jgi:hypothetical protein
MITGSHGQDISAEKVFINNGAHPTVIAYGP